MQVYTYFQDARVNADSGWLLNTWTKLWSAHGYEPIVLTEQDARRHPKFEDWRSLFFTFPSVNPKAYEMCCFLRWLPLSQTGGMMVDYDLLPVDFPPAAMLAIQLAAPITFCDRNRVPCCVIGTKAGFTEVLQWFRDYRMDVDDHFNNRPHISDMLITTRHREAATLDIVKEYGETKDAKMVHFPNDACGNGKRRAIERFFRL